MRAVTLRIDLKMYNTSNVQIFPLLKYSNIKLYVMTTTVFVFAISFVWEVEM